MKLYKIIYTQALKIYICIVVYFFAMKIVGADDIVQLRLLNFVFVFWGVNGAIKKNLHENSDNDYLTNLFVGFTTSILTVLFTVISLVVYITFLDSNFIHVIESSTFWGSELRLTMIVFAFLVEGVASSIICTFVLMQYWKNYKKQTLKD